MNRTVTETQPTTGDSHTHSHTHGMPSGRGANQRRLAITLVLIAVYMVAEIVGGLMADSLALLADAGHMLSDAAGLALSLFAVWIAQRPPNPRRTYGYYRAEILAALANAATLVAMAIVIFIEAWERLGSPQPVQGKLVFGIAMGGLAVNIVALWILQAGKSDNLNIHGAWLHVLTDALGSVAAIVAGGLIWLAGWNWADPVASMAIAVLVLYSSWQLLSEAVAVLMESVPKHINLDEVRDAMMSQPGTREVHDLHIWTITSGLDSLSAHVVTDDQRPHAELLRELRELLHKRFGIDHITIQIEPEGFDEQRGEF